MATVITNLLSAIPFIGNDIVPLSIILPWPPSQREGGYLLYIPPRRGDKTLSLNYNIDTSISYNKSLDMKDIDKNLLALIIGFIDGKGYIRITKKLNKSDITGENIPPVGGGIYMSLIINLNKNDLELLQYFNKHLNIGKVYNITPKKGNKLARWEINKSDLLNKFEPLLEYHNINFLTETNKNQYLLLKYIKNNKLIFYDDIILFKNKINKDMKINNPSYGYLNKWNDQDYFNNWLVGFTIAKGSFIIKKNQDICFQLKDKNNIELFNNIIKLFNTTTKLNISKHKYIEYSVSSKNDIQNIINFFSFSNNHSLLGNKLISYNKWLLAINNNVNYKELKTPYIISSLYNKDKSIYHSSRKGANKYKIKKIK